MTIALGDAGAVVRALTRHVPDFPKPGVVFADLTPVLADPVAFHTVVDALAVDVADAGGVDLVAGLDSRGFLLGAGVAYHLGVGVLAVRKAGKLPPPVDRCEYSLEYGSAALEIPAEGIPLRGRRVLVVDDVLATGGTMRAAITLLERAGAVVAGLRVVLELPHLGGRACLLPHPVVSLTTD